MPRAVDDRPSRHNHDEWITCALCQRQVPPRLITKHHLKPRQKGGKAEHRTPLCKPCHKQVHATFGNTDLARVYDSIESLRHASLLKPFLKWIRKQSPDRNFHTERSRAHRTMGSGGTDGRATSGTAGRLGGTVDVCAAGFALGSHSLHGPRHWRNVYFNGMQLVAESGGAADVTIVRLFAMLHDSQRLNEGHDPEHGQRAAGVAAGWRGQYFHLDAARLEILRIACAVHDRGEVSANATIGACWDADRLELPRVGIEPAKSLMSTAAGKRRAR